MGSRLNQLTKRLERLEATRGGEAIICICRYVDESDKATLARHGVNPGPNDLVVMITRYSPGACQGCTRAEDSG
jgi:hypothetical protein